MSRAWTDPWYICLDYVIPYSVRSAAYMFLVYRFYRFYFEADFLLWKSTGCRDTEVCDKIAFFKFSSNKCYFHIAVL